MVTVFSRPKTIRHRETGQELIRLVSETSTGDSLLWMESSVTFISTNPMEFAAFLAKDPRDIPWDIIYDDDQTAVPICHYQITWRAEECRLLLKYVGFCDMTPSDLISRIKSFFGYTPKSSTLARAPRHWKAVKMKYVQSKLESTSLAELGSGLSLIYGSPWSFRLPWAYNIFMKYLNHGESIVRIKAAVGIGELSRVTGYSENDRANKRLQELLRDESPGVRAAAAKALDEISRFANVPP
jgi:hypothetical protein